MKIGDDNFNAAVAIISTFRSKTTASFNVPVNDNYLNVYPIVLNNACPALLRELMEQGYSIGVNEKGAYVDKY